MPNRPIRVILVRPRNPNNIGACARAMANFGLSDLVVVDPYEPVWKETRAAPEAEKVVLDARAVSTWEEAVKNCSIIIGTSSFHQRPFEHATIELPNLNKHLASYSASDPLALIFGSERSGLSNEELARCQAVIHIPTQHTTPSMNLGQAVAVVLYEIRRGSWEPQAPPSTSPSLEMEPLIETLAALGEDVDYPAGYAPAARIARFRQALHGATLPPATVRFLLSFGRWLRKKGTSSKILLCLLTVMSIGWTETPPAADRSLWEIGMVAAGSYIPDYPAADHSRLKWIAAPYGVYRGKIMRADREGARARLMQQRYYEIDVGIAASFASRSKDNAAREGMPDLDYLLELGPRFTATLLRFGLNDKGILKLFIPVRAVFSTDFGEFRHRGFTVAPSLNARWPLPFTNWLAISQLTGNFANRQMSAYFYDVAPEFVRPDRPFYDAHAGYIGSDLFGGLLIPINQRLRLFTGAQALIHNGAANQDSPLFKRTLNYSLVAGLVWTFYSSPKQAILLD